MKYILLTLLLFAAPLMAQTVVEPIEGTSDTGLYTNIERFGEGIALSRNGDRIQFYFYTYKDWQGCPGIDIPDGGLVSDANCHMSRWFLTGGDIINLEDDLVEGWMYAPLGLDYPKCLPNPNDPFLTVCGETHIVGRYLLARTGKGWRMVVVRFGELLDKEDSLFESIFEFTTPVFHGTD